MLNLPAWHSTQAGLFASRWLSWRKVTTPGLSAPCGSCSGCGSRGRPSASAPPAMSAPSTAPILMSFVVVMAVSVAR